MVAFNQRWPFARLSSWLFPPLSFWARKEKKTRPTKLKSLQFKEKRYWNSLWHFSELRIPAGSRSCTSWAKQLCLLMFCLEPQNGLWNSCSRMKLQIQKTQIRKKCGELVTCVICSFLFSFGISSFLKLFQALDAKRTRMSVTETTLKAKRMPRKI